MSGNKLYGMEYLASVMKDDISSLTSSVRRAIEERLMVVP